mgnify:CR=1 FL=1
MNQEWLIIPDFNNFRESLALAEEYDAGFEYNDFFNPDVYSDEEEIKKRISLYKGCSRNPSRDTLHGVFLDMALASKDPVICAYSRKRMEQSMAIAQELGVKGVVFHSGLIRGLNQDTYLQHWYEVQEEWIRYLLNKFPDLYIFMENTFEETPIQFFKEGRIDNLDEKILDELISSGNFKSRAFAWRGEEVLRRNLCLTKEQ